jgi:hypothetical protein
LIERPGALSRLSDSGDESAVSLFDSPGPALPLQVVPQ